AISFVIWRNEGSPSTHTGGGNTDGCCCSASSGAFPFTRVTVLLIKSSLAGLSRIANLFQVTDVGPGSQFIQHLISPLAAQQLRHAAARVLQVAEDNRLRGAGLLARRLDFSIRQGAPALERDIFSQLNPLHAHAAFLHHAA